MLEKDNLRAAEKYFRILDGKINMKLTVRGGKTGGEPPEPIGPQQFSFTKEDFESMRSDRNRVLEQIGENEGRIWRVGDMPLRQDDQGNVLENPVRFIRDSEKAGLLKGIKSKRVLDFSSGLGRNALYLMKRGADITSVAYEPAERDFQKVWSERYQNKFKRQGCGTIDIRGGSFQQTGLVEGENFDVIICTNALAHASMHEGRDFIMNIQERTPSGGVHIVSTWNQHDERVGERARRRGGFITSGDANDELQKLYPREEWLHIGSSPDKRIPWSLNRELGINDTRSHSVIIAVKK
ncbi:MAG: methyltransferase domain-containing protein [Candidatus Altiarchaeota archaeon]